MVTIWIVFILFVLVMLAIPIGLVIAPRTVGPSGWTGAGSAICSGTRHW